MIIERDVPITASDGLVLRADVYRPDDKTGPVPAILVYGPYGKGVEYKDKYSKQWKWILDRHPKLLPGSTRSYMTWETPDPETWIPWGYACVRVDSRGTGRTGGYFDMLSPREMRDFYEAIEWAGTQKWSNGRVGLNGISYYGQTQWRVAALQPPHLAAMIPWEAMGDLYRDFGRHGGILSNAFARSWFDSQVVANQHGNKDGCNDPWLGEKATGPDVLSEEMLVANRADPVDNFLKRPLDCEWYRERSPDWSRVKVPFLSSSNWGGTGLHARGNYEGFTQAASKQKWLEVHSGRHDEGFYLDDAMAMQKRFFDHFLKDVDNGWDKEPPVILQMRRPKQPMGETRKELAWPLPRTQWTEFSLSVSGTETGLQPEESLKHDCVEFDARDGEAIFRTAPLDKEVEITGPLSTKLYISSTTTDADLFATIQAFSPEGEEVEFQGAWDPHTALAQGWLRASQRKLDQSKSTKGRPYHSHDESLPLEPGMIYELDVEIWPTHIILPAGYHLSMRIAGRDFQRPQTDENLAWRDRGSGPFLHDHPGDRSGPEYQGRTTIHVGGSTSSSLLLPIIPEH